MKEDKAARPLRPRTLQIHGGTNLGDLEIRPSLNRTVAHPLGSFENAKALFAGEREGFIYTRINNPTVDRLERKLASLEGAEAALVTSSGMSAVFLLALHFHLNNEKGAHLIASNRLYGGVFHLFDKILPAFGIRVTFVEDPLNPVEWRFAIQAGRRDGYDTSFLYVENPSNPVLDVFDIQELSEIAHNEAGAPLVVDSTLATPALLRPIELGADIVVHSLSKYMGDGEVIGGAICGLKGLIDDIRLRTFRDTGACISPDNAQILNYHVESLSSRMEEHCRNAAAVSSFLSRHPKVSRVLYPSFGLRSGVNQVLMPNGFGGLMAFEVVGGEAAARKVLESLRLFWHAPNIGESRSLVIHPATTTHNEMSPEERQKAGISDGLLRLSIGREDPLDLMEDLAQALEKI